MTEELRDVEEIIKGKADTPPGNQNPRKHGFYSKVLIERILNWH